MFNFKYSILHTGPLAKWVVFTNGQEDWSSRLSHNQRLLMPLCLTLSIICYGLKVKWDNPGKGEVPFPTPQCSSYWKGSLQLALDDGCQLYLFYIRKYIFSNFFLINTFFLLYQRYKSFIILRGTDKMNIICYSFLLNSTTLKLSN